MMRRLEDRLFWWLYERWRTRATVTDLRRHRDWLLLDIQLKGGDRAQS